MKQRNLPRNSVFINGYKEANPVKWMRRFGRQWKWAYQRAMYGYCDFDVWNMRGFLLSVIPDMLEELADIAHGFPVGVSDGVTPVSKILVSDNETADSELMEQWKSTLREMAYYFREADEETCQKKNPYEAEWRQAHREFEAEYGLFGSKIPMAEGEDSSKGRRMYCPGDFDKWKKISQLYFKEESVKNQYRMEMLKTGMNMLRDWFWDLFD